MAVSAHAVWATSVLADAVTRIDPSSNRVDETIALTAPQDLEAAPAGMWVSTGAPPVQRVNVDFAQDMLQELDLAARQLNVSRQAVIKIFVRQALNQQYLAQKARDAK